MITETNLQAGGALGGAIRQIRARKGISRRQLAAHLGCPKNTITSWEIGRYAPNAARLIRLRSLAETPEEKAPIEAALEHSGILPSSLTSTMSQASL